MIKIKIDDIDSIKKWYKKSIIDIVMARDITHIPSNDFEKKITNSLLNRPFCSDVLILSLDEILKKYDWVKQYYETMLFLKCIPNLLNEYQLIKGTGSRKIRKKILVDFVEDNRNELLDTELTRSSAISIEDELDDVCSAKYKFLAFIGRLKKYIEKDLADIIKQRFNYEEVLSSTIRGQLVNKLNIKVCPYCNRQYINPVTIDKNHIYLGDIDHILPKGRYSLFQLSLFNFIPACKPCNQLFKRQKTAQILNPHYEGFGNDAFYKVNYSSVKELIGLDEHTAFNWEIVNDKTGKIKNNIDTFQLNEVYETNSPEFRRILKIKYLFESSAYRDSIKHILGISDSIFSELFDEVLLYGVSLDDDKFQDELLSKAIYDIVINN